MRFTVLGSGSTGNAVLISSEKTNVLVDAGMSAREIVRRLAEMGVAADDLDEKAAPRAGRELFVEERAHVVHDDRAPVDRPECDE